MLESRIPPPPPSSSFKAATPRPASQVYASSPSSAAKNNIFQRPELASPIGSTSLTPRSYRQPAGTAQLERSASTVHAAGGSGSGGGAVGGLQPRNTWSGVSRSAASPLGRSTSGLVRTGRKRNNVFVDVIMEQRGDSVEQRILDVLPVLGAPLTISLEDSFHTTTRSSRPTTPSKLPTVDPAKVRQHIQELWTTERSYKAKMESLYRDYAKPLRTYAKSPATAIIPAFEAKHLFANIEEIVPITVAFERDLADVMRELEETRERVPARFGEVVLRHVKKMTGPYKSYLPCVPNSAAIYQSLESNSSFLDFVERAEIASQETTGTMGGLKSFLAEPFQRVSRYQLMLQPIVRHLPATDESVLPIKEALAILSDICSMRIDEKLQAAAVAWGLGQTIEGYPVTMVDAKRRFLTCIDVDEIVSPTSLSASTSGGVLRCTLFLFTDRVLVAKRPPSLAQTGRQLAGLGDIDSLTTLYTNSAARLTSSQSNLLGSPKKLKKGVLGFRGTVNISEVLGMDLGGTEMGIKFERPPVLPAGGNDRWSGREERRFVVAETYPGDVRIAEKEDFLRRVAEARCAFLAGEGGEGNVRKSVEIPGPEDGEDTVIYWNVWKRGDWEKFGEGRRGALALYIDTTGSVKELPFGAGGKPMVIARATLLDGGACRFSVEAQDRNNREAETIRIPRIVHAVSEIASSFGFSDFPPARPMTPRSRSRLASVALDVFGSVSGGSNSLKRGKSNTSKSSTGTSTLSYTSSSVSVAGIAASSSFASERSERTLLSPAPSRIGVPAKLVKKSSPVWYGNRPKSVCGGETRTAIVLDEDRGYGGLESSEDEPREANSEDSAMEVLKSARKIFDRTDIPDPTPAHYSPLPPPPQPSFLATRSTPAPVPQRLLESDVFGDIPMRASSPTTMQSNAASPRRRPMGPRAPSPWKEPPSHLSNPSPIPRDPSPPPLVPIFSAARSSSPSPSQTSTFSNSKRAASPPQPYPVKKTARLSPLQSDAPAPLVIRKRITSGGTLKKPTRRVTSGSSTVRPENGRPSSALVEPVVPDERRVSIGLPPLEDMQDHVAALRTQLAREVANKENARLASPSLSRSPNTRNLLTSISSPTRHSSIDVKKHGGVELSFLLRWVNRLDEIVDAWLQLQSGSPDGPTESELALVSAERDLLKDELASVQKEVEKLKTSLECSSKALNEARLDVSSYKTQYEDIKGEVAGIYESFEADMCDTEELFLKAIREQPGTKLDLLDVFSTMFRDLVTSRCQAEQTLMARELEIKEQLAEKEKWGRMLRENGLIQ